MDLFKRTSPPLPSVPELKLETIKEIASGIEANSNQAVYNYNIVSFGPPPGLPKYPELDTLQKSKTIAKPFNYAGAPTSSDAQGYTRFISHMRQIRRKPGPRQIEGSPSDVLYPTLFS